MQDSTTLIEGISGIDGSGDEGLAADAAIMQKRPGFPAVQLMSKADLSREQRQELLGVLKARFEKNGKRHEGLEWIDVQARLTRKAAALRSLSEMERTGGEPDVIGRDEETGEYVFCDCSAESPEGRRNVCYDRAGQEKRAKEGLPVAGNVLDLAAAMGIEPLTEEQYGALQKLGTFDAKTQSWLKTPAEVAKLGGAIFGERRFGRVFVGANTAPCFYRGRGFRGLVRV
ncbi:MAG TPA: DUF4256 domain-containing protein [Bryobacteraceae bacterium]|jgi:hypothetical protein